MSVEGRLDAYKVLQVDPEADPEVIQAAYRRLAQKWHPDVAPGPEADAAAATGTARRWTDPAKASGAPAGAGSPTGASGAHDRANATRASSGTPRPPEEISRDWTSGRSSTGHTYDSGSMRTADGTGAAGTPPGNPSGSALNFGRYAGWSLGEIARMDLEYLEWLDRMPIGRPYRDEIDEILRRTGRRRSAAAEQTERRGLFRRR